MITAKLEITKFPKSLRDADRFPRILRDQYSKAINKGLAIVRQELELVTTHVTGKSKKSWRTVKAAGRSYIFFGRVYSKSYGVSVGMHGRKPGNFPNLRQLKRWVQLEKGEEVQGSTTKQRARDLDRILYRVGRKIARRGIKPHMAKTFKYALSRARERIRREVDMAKARTALRFMQ